MHTRLRGDNFNWTPKRVEELRSMIKDKGMSYGAIHAHWREEKNCPSRSAIAGKAKRQGFVANEEARKHEDKKRGKPASTKTPSAITMTTGGGATFLSMKRVKGHAAPSPVIVQNVLDPIKLEHGRPATVADLNESMCRFPIGDPRLPDFAYCGRVNRKGPYCTDHHAIVYQPPKKAA